MKKQNPTMNYRTSARQRWVQNNAFSIDFIEFVPKVLKFQNFWDEFDEIDRECVVLDPSLPCARSVVHRRILLLHPITKEEAQLQLQVNPRRPRQIPACDVLGATRSIRFLQASLDYSMMGDARRKDFLEEVKETDLLSSHKWSESLSAFENLSKV